MKALWISLAVTALMVGACAPVDAGSPAPIPPGDGPTQCKADQYQRYVGHNRSDLPERPVGEVWRVVCTTCPMTMDYNGHRMNILFDRATGVIQEVTCG